MEITVSSEKNNRLSVPCKLCGGLYSHFIVFKTEFFDVEALMQSALLGCKDCEILHMGIKAINPSVNSTTKLRFDYNPTDLSRPGSLIVDQYRDPVVPFQQPEDSVEFISVQGSSSCSSLILDLLTSTGNPTSGKEIYAIGSGSGNIVAVRLTLEVAVQQITKWLKLCKEEHDACWASSGDPPPTLPTRVLDLGQHDSEDSIKLVDGNGAKEKFMTLSHCWGDTHPMATTHDSILERKTQIMLSDLPKTFLQFVKLAKAVSVRYVWIDSLCIIQDDGADWAREAGKMAAIYASSYLNIAAAHASGCNGGLFPGDELLEKFRPTRIHEIRTKKAQRMNIVARTPITQAHNAMKRWEKLESEASVLQSHRAHAPLLTRAWVYQERTLAPRTVYFHASEMVWDCKCKMRCECGRLDSMPESESSALYQRLTLLHKQPTYDSTHRWMEIVMLYTGLNLTKASDTLPALSGLARAFQPMLYRPVKGEDDYLARMWKDSFPESLLWVARDLDVDGKPPPRYGRRAYPYRAPTWSWASIDAYSCFASNSSRVPTSISYCQSRPERWNFEFPFNLRVLSGSCTPSSANPYGEVSDGLLRLDGWAFTPDWCRVEWTPIQTSSGNSLNQSPTRCQIGVEDALSMELVLEPGLARRGILRPAIVELDVVADDDMGVSKPTQLNANSLRCLSIASERSVGLWFLLLKATDGTQTTWERIGAGHVDIGGYGEDLSWRRVGKAQRSEFTIV